MTSGMRNAAADLDQLAARDDELAPAAGERGGGEQRRGGAVVDHERRLGAGQLAQQRLDVGLARAALARRRGRTRGSRSPRPRAATARARRVGQRRPPEVRVHDHAGRVEHAPQRRPQPRRARARRGRPRRRRRLAGARREQLRAALGELGPRDRRRQPVDRRQRPQALLRRRGAVWLARPSDRCLHPAAAPVRIPDAPRGDSEPSRAVDRSCPMGSVWGTPRAPAASLRRRGSPRAAVAARRVRVATAPATGVRCDTTTERTRTVER